MPVSGALGVLEGRVEEVFEVSGASDEGGLGREGGKAGIAENGWDGAAGKIDSDWGDEGSGGEDAIADREKSEGVLWEEGADIGAVVLERLGDGGLGDAETGGRGSDGAGASD